MKIQGTMVSPSLSFALALITTLLSSSMSAYVCLPPHVRSVYFIILAFQWCIIFKATLRGVTEMLSIGWLPHQQSHAFDDVSTPVVVRALVIAIPSHIVNSV